MAEELNIVLHIEGEPRLVIETNLNLKPASTELYAQVWLLPDSEKNQHARNECLKTYYGRHALTDAVLYLGELLGGPVAHRIRRSA